jgi:hypothetical protein
MDQRDPDEFQGEAFAVSCIIAAVVGIVIAFLCAATMGAL